MNLSVLQDAWTQLTHSPLWLIVAAMTLALGLTIKSIRFIPNNLIPIFTLTFSTATYALMGDRSQISPTQPFPVILLGFYGFLDGFVAWALHKIILSRFEKFFPWLQPAIAEFDSTPPIPLADGSNTKPVEGK